MFDSIKDFLERCKTENPTPAFANTLVLIYEMQQRPLVVNFDNTRLYVCVWLLLLSPEAPTLQSHCLALCFQPHAKAEALLNILRVSTCCVKIERVNVHYCLMVPAVFSFSRTRNWRKIVADKFEFDLNVIPGMEVFIISTPTCSPCSAASTA